MCVVLIFYYESFYKHSIIFTSSGVVVMTWVMVSSDYNTVNDNLDCVI